jgi:hypothetical protein
MIDASSSTKIPRTSIVPGFQYLDGDHIITVVKVYHYPTFVRVQVSHPGLGHYWTRHYDASCRPIDHHTRDRA